MNPKGSVPEPCAWLSSGICQAGRGEVGRGHRSAPRGLAPELRGPVPTADLRHISVPTHAVAPSAVGVRTSNTQRILIRQGGAAPSAKCADLTDAAYSAFGVLLLPAAVSLPIGPEYAGCRTLGMASPPPAVLQYDERCCPATAVQMGAVAQHARDCLVVWVVRADGPLSAFAKTGRAQCVPAARGTARPGSGSRMSWQAGWCRRNRLMVADGMRWPVAFFYTCW
jgi:hypothetical protein